MRVVVTGLGAVSGAGVGRAAFREAWREPRRGRVDFHSSEPPFVGSWETVQAVDFDAAAVLGRKGLQFMTRGTRLVLAAAREAAHEADIDPETNELALGVVLGTNFAGLGSITNYDWTVVSEGPAEVTPMEGPNTLANICTSHLSIRMRTKALNTTVSTGRCASVDALGYAAHCVREGWADAILCGGAEEVNREVLAQYRAMAPNGSADFTPGEGAAILVIEKEDGSAPGRVPALAEIAGWSNCLAPTLEPRLLVEEVCREALAQAGLEGGNDVALVALGVNGDAGFDQPLAAGVSAALGPGASRPAFSLKGFLGETCGAAGALHAVAAVAALISGEMPASPGLDFDDAAGALSFSTAPRPFEKGPVLLAEWDLAGFASALVLRPADSERDRNSP